MRACVCMRGRVRTNKKKAEEKNSRCSAKACSQSSRVQRARQSLAVFCCYRCGRPLGASCVSGDRRRVRQDWNRVPKLGTQRRNKEAPYKGKRQEKRYVKWSKQEMQLEKPPWKRRKGEKNKRNCCCFQGGYQRSLLRCPLRRSVHFPECCFHSSRFTFPHFVYVSFCFLNWFFKLEALPRVDDLGIYSFLRTFLF